MTAPTITTRAGKGSDLSYVELDEALNNLAAAATVSAKDSLFGAVADGSTDDTVALQALLSYFSTLRSGEAWLPPGVYKTTKPLFYRGDSGQSLRLRGAGRAASGTTSTVIHCTAAVDSALIINGACNSIIEGLTINAPLATNGIHVTADNVFNATLSVGCSAGSQTVTPTSMSNIAVGSAIGIGSGATYEVVYVTAATGSTFTATFLYAHSAGEQVGHGPGSSAVHIRDCTIVVPTSGTAVGVLFGNVTASATMQVSEVTCDRVLAFSGGADAGFKVITSGNVKNFSFRDCTMSGFDYGIHSAVAAGRLKIDACTFATIAVADVFCNSGFVEIASCESESFGNRFVSGADGANAGTLLLTANDWECACAADDIAVSTSMNVVLIGNNFNNTRTGSSYPKIQAANIGYPGSNAASVYSVGNYYQNATDTSAVFVDGSLNEYFIGSGDAFGLPNRLFSFNDQGGPAGAIVGLTPVAGPSYGFGRAVNVSPGSVTAGLTYGAVGQESAGFHKVTIPYTVFKAAALTADVQCFSLPPKSKVVQVIADTTTAFAGLAGTIQVQVGTTSGGSDLLLAHDVKSAAVTKGLADADMGASLTRANAIAGGYIPSWTAAAGIFVRLTSGTGNIGNGSVSNLNAGSVTLYLLTDRVL